MRTTLTFSLLPPPRKNIARAAKGLGVTESEVVRRALQDHLWQQSFEASRRKLVPEARARDIYSDEDVFKLIS